MAAILEPVILYRGGLIHPRMNFIQDEFTSLIVQFNGKKVILVAWLNFLGYGIAD